MSTMHTAELLATFTVDDIVRLDYGNDIIYKLTDGSFMYINNISGRIWHVTADGDDHNDNDGADGNDGAMMSIMMVQMIIMCADDNDGLACRKRW